MKEKTKELVGGIFIGLGFMIAGLFIIWLSYKTSGKDITWAKILGGGLMVFGPLMLVPSIRRSFLHGK